MFFPRILVDDPPSPLDKVGDSLTWHVALEPELEVFSRIVGSHTVLVVDLLPVPQLPAKHSFHNHAMLSDV